MLNRSTWLPGVIICLLGAAGFAAALLWHHQWRPLPQLAGGDFITPRRELPAFSLIDHHGRPFTRADLQGHWSMLYFGYTHCPDLCPATLSALAAMEKRLASVDAPLRPHVIFVSADVARDTPAQLATYVPYFEPSFLGVTAHTQADVETFAAELGIAVAINHQPDGTYTVDHSSAILVVDPLGRMAAVLTGPFTAAALQSDYLAIVRAPT
jgi:protein SCO1/2